jgi:hypothetical protein
MSETTIKKTTSVRESLLTFGQIEGALHFQGTNATHGSIGESLNREHPNEVYRLLAQLRAWLPESTIEGSRRGQILRLAQVSNESYQEFVAVLLALNAMKDGIRTLLADLSTTDLKQQGMMSILSNLILAKDEACESCKKVTLRYRHKKQTLQFRFRPEKIFLLKNKWCLEGKFIDPPPTGLLPPLLLKRILSAKRI